MSTRRYSNVDESLFGERTKSISQLNGARKKSKAVAPIASNSIVVTQGQLDAIVLRSKLKSAAQLAKEKEDNDQVLQQKKAAAKARKEKMLRLADEARSRTKKSDIELENLEREATIRALAQEKMDMNNDLVKLLKSLGCKAEAFTVRESQLNDRSKKEAAEKEYNDKMDEIMEKARIEDIERRERIENDKKVKRFADRHIITDQIKARELKRLEEEEAREREGQAMVAEAKRWVEEDRIAAEKKNEEIKLMRVEIMKANEAAIQGRKALKENERLEVQQILEYQLKRDAELRAREEAELAIELKKKEIQANLLAQQEKFMGNQAEQDELRARRAAESKEREARNREKEEATKRKKDLLELNEARKKQAEHKKSLMAREASMQNIEYEAALKYNASIAQREAAEEERKKENNMIHLKELMQQIHQIETKRNIEKNAKYEEGRQLRQEYAAERVRLETLKEHIITDMISKGVNPKYMSEMKRTDINKLQMR